jgi:uncharacterized protein involved in propanediol utilization
VSIGRKCVSIEPMDASIPPMDLSIAQMCVSIEPMDASIPRMDLPIGRRTPRAGGTDGSGGVSPI